MAVYAIFPVMRPYNSWLKIRNSSDAAVEDKDLDKSNKKCSNYKRKVER